MGAFSIFSSKKKKADGDSGIHYRRLGTIVTVCKFLCLLLTLVIVLWGFSFHTDEINMDNFKYLANSLSGDNVQFTKYDVLYYDKSEDNRFAFVRSDLAVVNSNGSTVYALNGDRRSADSTLKMDDPKVLWSAKYMYIYDLGGTEFVVKNSLETVKTINYSYAIRGAAAADNGYFAVVSSEKTTRSSVFVYDDKYREIYKRTFGSQYTLAVDINNTTDRLLTASVYALDGNFVTELGLYSINDESTLAAISYTGEYPYKVCFNGDDGFMLLTDKGCRFFDNSGVQLSFVEFGITGIDDYCLNDRGFISMYSSATMSARETIELYDGVSGKLLYADNYEKGIRLARCYDEHLFVISDGTVYIVRLSDGEIRTASVPSDVLELLLVEKEKVLVLTEGTGEVLDFGDLFTEDKEESAE